MKNKVEEKSSVQIAVEKEVLKRQNKEKKEKVIQTSKEIERQLEEYKTKWIESFSKLTKSSTETEIRKVYNNYKTWRFLDKLHTFCLRVIMIADQLKAINDVTTILDDVNEMFVIYGNSFATGNFSLFKKNVKKFSKKLRKMDKKMDDIIGILDTLFDPRPNFFKRLFGNREKKIDIGSMRDDYMKLSGGAGAPAANENPAPVQGGSGSGGLLPPED